MSEVIIYLPIVGDLFHFGHLNAIKNAKNLGTILIAGVLTDNAVNEYRRKPIANFHERYNIIKELKTVDRCITQYEMSPVECLKKLLTEYPMHKIIIVYGEIWKNIPSEEWIVKNGIQIKKIPYYKNLSDDVIARRLIDSISGSDDTRESLDKLISPMGFTSFGTFEYKSKTLISTKALTLKALKPLVKFSKIENGYFFTVKNWKYNKLKIVNDITQEFQDSSLIVVRSSTLNEDTLYNSMAGEFDSFLNVKLEPKSIENAIDLVIKSYEDKNSKDLNNQILIQSQTKKVKMSGVVFTRTLNNSKPYYLINYDITTLTDTVTSGKDSKVIYISKFIELQKIPSKWKNLILAIKDIESLIPSIPLDIEFAINDLNDIIIFQVRPLTISNYQTSNDNIHQELLKNSITELKAYSQTSDNWILSDMSDWNPAEIIGDNPKNLAYDIYNQVIMESVWDIARYSQGYSSKIPQKLMYRIGNKPYVNVKNSFNSFVPQQLDKNIKYKLVDACISYLKKYPHLHDKVEFLVIPTAFDFSLHNRLKYILNDVSSNISTSEITKIVNAYKKLTLNLITEKKFSINDDISISKQLRVIEDEIFGVNYQELDEKEFAKKIKILIEKLKNYGTLTFSRLARLAFIADIIMKNITELGYISNDELNQFYGSLTTVAKDYAKLSAEVKQNPELKNEFLEKFGHLRPGTYEITSLRYDQRPDIINFKSNLNDSENHIHLNDEFTLSTEKVNKINNLFKENEFDITFEKFIIYAKKAIQSREYSKFIFSKTLSNIIELISFFGKTFKNIDREQCSHLFLDELLYTPKEELSKQIIENQKLYNNYSSFLLNSFITSVDDLMIIDYHIKIPNFITNKQIMAQKINVGLNFMEGESLDGKIVLIENGDPGFDWIFGYKILGLVTKYGGMASHMAIRCAEFGIPAAIGIGEEIYAQIEDKKFIYINAKDNKLEGNDICGI